MPRYHLVALNNGGGEIDKWFVSQVDAIENLNQAIRDDYRCVVLVEYTMTSVYNPQTKEWER